MQDMVVPVVVVRRKEGGNRTQSRFLFMITRGTVGPVREPDIQVISIRADHDLMVMPVCFHQPQSRADQSRLKIGEDQETEG